MEVVEDLKKKINHIEYEEIKDMKEKIGKVEMDVAKMSLLTEQSINTTSKLTEAMDSMKDTMLDISYSIKQNNEGYNKLSSKVDAVGEKVNNLETKVDEIDGKTKIDWTEYVRKNFFMLAFGLTGLIIASTKLLSFIGNNIIGGIVK